MDKKSYKKRETIYISIQIYSLKRKMYYRLRFFQQLFGNSFQFGIPFFAKAANKWTF